MKGLNQAPSLENNAEIYTFVDNMLLLACCFCQEDSTEIKAEF